MQMIQFVRKDWFGLCVVTNFVHWTIGSLGGVQIFSGHESDPDNFQLMYLDGSHLLVGARNVVYNLSVHTLEQNSIIIWEQMHNAQWSCIQKQIPKENCQNYIKLIVRISKEKIYMCGTNAFSPLCQMLELNTDGVYLPVAIMDQDALGYGRVPQDPTFNNSYVYTDGKLFTGTMTSWLNRADGVIYSSPVITQQQNSEWLNAPNFVGAMEDGDKVYFFFREVAVEHINCGKAVFSRVSQLCKKDAGGGRLLLENIFTSFFKARLNCSIPGEYPFYFDEIQSVSEKGQGNYMSSLSVDNKTDMVYAVFNTPRNAISGSAVCAYRLSDIQKSFEGPFKGRGTPTSIWLPVREDNVPSPHPAKTCSEDSNSLPHGTLTFISQHHLMDQAVPAFGGQPLFVDTDQRYRITQIAVHWQVRAANSRYYDVLYLGTNDGHVLKVVNVGRNEINTVVVEDLQLVTNGSPVISLKLLVGSQLLGMEKLVVMFRHEILAVPLQRCHEKSTCSSCIALRDPYCTWYGKKCSNHPGGLQNIEAGVHEGCSNKNTNGDSEPTACREGYYGEKCKLRCPINCDGSCDKSSGSCPKCKAGFHGSDCVPICSESCYEDCDQDLECHCATCQRGYYGENCVLTESVNMTTAAQSALRSVNNSRAIIVVVLVVVVIVAVAVAIWWNRNKLKLLLGDEKYIVDGKS